VATEFLKLKTWISLGVTITLQSKKTQDERRRQKMKDGIGKKERQNTGFSMLFSFSLIFPTFAITFL